MSTKLAHDTTSHILCRMTSYINNAKTNLLIILYVILEFEVYCFCNNKKKSCKLAIKEKIQKIKGQKYRNMSSD